MCATCSSGTINEHSTANDVFYKSQRNRTQMLKTASINEVHSTIEENNVCIINLGRKHNFNILPVEKIKETEKAIQFGSLHTPRHTIWFPKKALKECKEVPGTFSIAPWFDFDSWGSLFLSSNMRRSMSTLEF